MADPLLTAAVNLWAHGQTSPLYEAQAELGSIPHGRSIRDASWRLTLDLG